MKKMNSTLLVTMLVAAALVLAQVFRVLTNSFYTEKGQPSQWDVSLFSLSPEGVLVWMMYAVPIAFAIFLGVVARRVLPGYAAFLAATVLSVALAPLFLGILVNLLFDGIPISIYDPARSELIAFTFVNMVASYIGLRASATLFAPGPQDTESPSGALATE